MSIYLGCLMSLGLVLASACGKKNSFKEEKSETTGVTEQTEGDAPKEISENATSGSKGIDRTIDQVLCQDGFKLLKLIDKPSMNDTFGLLCGSEATTALFQELVAKAYAGSGEPGVKLVHFTIGELFVTRMIVAYAMKVPLNDPSLFYSLKAHDVLASGIQQSNSEIVGEVESRRTFPGRRSVEEIVLNYSLNKSEGGGLFDKRRTEFNTYLLNESRTDVVVSTEELLGAATNKSYHDYKGFVIGLKGEPGFTNLVFINDFTIKNRIDPLRLQRTLMALSQGMQKKMYTFFTSKGAAQ